MKRNTKKNLSFKVGDLVYSIKSDHNITYKNLFKNGKVVKVTNDALTVISVRYPSQPKYIWLFVSDELIKCNDQLWMDL